MALIAVLFLVALMPVSRAWACGTQVFCVDVTKSCEDALSAGDAISFWGTVTNCGDSTMWDVIVVDELTDEVLLIADELWPGESATYSGSYVPSSCTSTNVVKASAMFFHFCTDGCGSDCVPGFVMAYDWAEATCDIINCDQGCTLTPGYWKTHADPARKQYDETWDLLSEGPDTVFFLSGQSYLEVIWQDSSGGNAYYILGQAFIAAQLNVMGGAFIPADVQSAWDEATSLFETYTPAEIGMLSGDDPLRQQFIGLATILDDYNNGLTGPGHCD